MNTPDLCDAHAGDVQIATPLLRSFGGKAGYFGRIATVRCLEDNSKVRKLLEQPGEDRVLVVDGGGSLMCALLGDALATIALANRWRGVIVHGCVRDVQVLGELPLGVHALAAHPRKSDKRDLGEVDVEVAFAGVRFVPGQWVFADSNGIVVAARDLCSDG